MQFDQEKSTGNEPGSGHYHGGWHHHGWWWPLRLFWIALVLVVIFSFIAMFAGFRGWHRGYYGSYGRNGYMMDGRGYYGQMMRGGYGPGYGMMGRWNSAGQTFGIITKIEGNKITISDNGNKEQPILSQAQTSILSSNGSSLSLKDLKVGQKVAVSGSAGSDGSIQASIIEVQP